MISVFMLIHCTYYINTYTHNTCCASIIILFYSFASYAETSFTCYTQCYSGVCLHIFRLHIYLYRYVVYKLCLLHLMHFTHIFIYKSIIQYSKRPKTLHRQLIYHALHKHFIDDLAYCLHRENTTRVGICSSGLKIT